MKTTTLVGIGLVAALAVAFVTPSGRAATFTSNTLIQTNDLTYEGQDIVVNHCTLTVNGAHAFNSLIVTNGGVVTHPAAPNGEATNRLNLTITADVFIGTNSAVDVSGKGYGTGSGPGKGIQYYSYSPGSGAGYGGQGGTDNSGGPGGAPYGSMTEPVDVGSGGGSGSSQGGAGGGAMRLTVAGQLRVDGVLRANGLNGGIWGAGGSGGSIYLRVGTLTGGGLIQANAGNDARLTAEGGSGGGRIAVYYSISHHTNVFEAFGGTGKQWGGAGTIYLKGDAETLPEILLGNNSTNIGALTTVSNASQLPRLMVTGGVNVRFTDLSAIAGDLAVTNSTVQLDALADIGGSTTVSNSALTSVRGVNMAGSLTAVGPAVVALNLTNNVGQDVTLVLGAVLTHSGAQTNGFLLLVTGNMIVDAASRVDVSGKGYGTRNGPGKGIQFYGYSNGSGAGYGGQGGADDSGGPGGAPYGSMTEPVDVGSGGASGITGVNQGGPGGGAMRLTVGGQLRVDGLLGANGVSGGIYGAGGSGGSIYLRVGTLTGGGLIQANGGNGSRLCCEGGGGGGRIAIYYQNSMYAGPLRAYGGSGCQSGGAGTIYVKGEQDPLPDILLSNNDANARNGPATVVSGVPRVRTLSIVGGANTLLAGVTNVTADLKVTNSTLVSAGALDVYGSVIGHGPNAVLTFIGTNTVGQNVSLLSGAVLTHSAAQTNGFLLLVTGNMTVDAASRVDVSGKGYGTGSGPGKGIQYYGYSPGSGAGYGGQGGTDNSGGPGGAPYGSMTEPVDVGSGGASGITGVNQGGAGGGAMRLTVAGQLRVDGLLGANGVSGGIYGAGGSGGSIYLRVGTLTGGGLIQANGGNGSRLGCEGGGGGGRVALYQHCFLFTGSFKAGGGTGYQAGGTGTVYVVWVNAPPVLPCQPDVALNELETLTITNAASDPDCPPNELTYRLESPPDGASISPVGVITWVPSEAQGPGIYTIKTVVTDYNPLALINQRLSSTNNFTVTVNEINVAPGLNLPGTVVMDEMTPFSLTASATDPDIPTNTLTFDLVSGPPGLTVSPGGAIAWLPGEADGPAVHAVAVQVTDYNADAVNEKHLSTTGTFNIHVREVNRPPTLTPPGNQVVVEELPLTLAIAVTDPDLPANALTFSLLSPPEGAAIHPTSGVITWTPAEAQGPSTNTLTVVVTDDSPLAVNAHHLSATNTFILTVQESNSPPVLAPIADRTITAEDLFSHSAVATDRDIPANLLSFSLLSAPDGMAITTAGEVSWQTSDGDAYTTNQIAVVVRDDGVPLLTATQRFTVIVLPKFRLQFALEQVEVTDLAKNPPVATQFTTYPEVSWSSKPDARYGVHDADSPHDPSLWHTNLFEGQPWIRAKRTRTTIRGPFLRQTIPAWGVDQHGPSNHFFRVQPLP